MSDKIFVVGFCPSCDTGPLGVRRCGVCEKPHVMCEECDAVWLTRDTTQPAIYPRQPDLPCLACGESLQGDSARWAGWRELVEMDWDQIEGDA